jgi:hypothetical protein
MYRGEYYTPRTIKEAEKMVMGLCPGVRLAGQGLKGKKKLSKLIYQFYALKRNGL